MLNCKIKNDASNFSHFKKEYMTFGIEILYLSLYNTQQENKEKQMFEVCPIQ